jgi:protocatechuate 3,4-dioxygenase beta subunit
MCTNDHHTSTLDGGHPANSEHPDGDSGLTRRHVLGAAGAGGVALLFAGIGTTSGGRLLKGFGPDVADAAATACVMTPAKTIGPYFVEEKLNRSDVRTDTSTGAVQAGVPLTLKMQIFDADNGCAPVQGATVDIWHANAAGLYSDESANGTAGQNWLRGYQTTDADGLVTFTTIYPGWYSGRAVHIHFKVRIYDGTSETLEFTSQMFFSDEMNAAIFKANAPYNTRSATPDTLDTKDGILGSDAATLTLNPTSDGNGGYTADFSAGVAKSTSQLNNTSAGAGGGGAPGGGGPGTGTTTSADKTVGIGLKAVTTVRTAHGTRQVRLTFKASERVALTAKLVRGDKTIAKKTVVLATGTTNVKLPVPAATKAGATRLRVAVKDAAGNRKSYSRVVHVSSLKR